MWLNEVTCYCYTPIHIQIWISFYSSTDLKQSDARIHWNFSLFGMIVSSRILLYSSWKQYYTPDATILMQLDNLSTLSSGLVHSALPLNVIPWSSYSISRKSHLKATENAVRIYWSSKNILSCIQRLYTSLTIEHMTVHIPSWLKHLPSSVRLEILWLLNSFVVDPG
jgi:hypothetical protein